MGTEYLVARTHQVVAFEGLHIDWDGAPPEGKYQVCNTMWMVDAFTPENGATRIVPGSHNWVEHPAKAWPDSAKTHPQEKLALGEVGDVVVFNSHCWHGGTLNRASAPRHGVTVLAQKLWDKEKGGFYWAVDDSGRPTRDWSDEKHAYGNAFGIYAAASSYAVTKDPDALDLARRGFRWLDEHAHDAKNGGDVRFRCRLAT